MKKLFIFIGLSILLQVLYYFIFMRDQFMNGEYSYSMMSIISLAFFLALFILKTYKSIGYSLAHNINNLIVAVLIIIVLYALMTFWGVWGNMVVGAIHFFFYNSTTATYHNPMIGNIFEYNLILLNIVLMLMNIFVTVIQSKNESYDRILRTSYKVATYILLIGIAALFIFNLSAFYYFYYIIMALLFIWGAIPVFYHVCEEFHQFYGVLVGFSFTIYFLWPMLNFIFTQITDLTYGYLFI